MFLKDIEQKPAEEIKTYQEELLTLQLEYLAKNSPFYKEHFLKHNVDTSKIRTIEDLKYIPPTTKNDLQTRNMDFLCVTPDKVIDYITTSGTSGDPVIFAATNNDLDRLAYNEYMSFLCAGGNKNDLYQLMVTLDRRFMAGLAYFLGLRKLGAGAVRVGPGNPELQFDTLKRLQPTAFVSVPSFLLKLMDYADANGIDYRNSSVKSVVCIGEPLRNADLSMNKLATKIKERWDVDLYCTYASTEMGAAFTECEKGCGGHLRPELLVVEFLNENDEPVKDGEAGEVTITNLGVEGMPLLRFKTGDICHHYHEPCGCGRNTMRLGPVIGRKNQMIKYKGTTLYPPAFYDILNDIKGVENYIVVVSTNNIETDDILIKVGCHNPDKKFEKSIKDHFRAKLRVAPSIKFMTPKEIMALQFPEMSRKPITFIDRRKR